MRLSVRTKAIVMFATTLTALVGLTAPANAGVEGGGCREPIHVDGTYVQPCIKPGPDRRSVTMTVNTWGSNHTRINLCMELLEVWGNITGPTTDPYCEVVWADSSSVMQNIEWVSDGYFVTHAWFTSPTYYDGGESPRAHVYSP